MKKLFLLLFSFACIYLSAQTAFKHTAIASNITEGWTTIDNTITNNNPNAILQVTSDYGSSGPYHNKSIGVRYTNGKWAIFNQDRTPMTINAKFNVMVVQPSENAFTCSGSPSGHIMVINNSKLNNNPNAKFLVTQNWGSGGPYNNNPFGIYYNGSNWAIYNQNFARMPINTKFNITIDNEIFIVTANEPQANYFLFDNVSTTNKSNALVFTTQYWTNVYNPNEVGVWFSDNKWSVYNQSIIALPLNSKFMILSINQLRLVGYPAGFGRIHQNRKSCIDWPTSEANRPQPACNNCAIQAPLTAVNTKMWATGSILRVKMDGGSDFIKSKVRLFAREWSNYANIRFNFVNNGDDAEIMITFGSDGKSYSKIGTDAVNEWFRAGETLGIVPHETMHFGWFTDTTSDVEFRQVVLHEFGHALGFVHEHLSPAADIPWNREVVYARYSGPPNNWSREEIDINLFQRYRRTETQYTSYDNSSIMQYPIDPSETLGGFSAPWNTNLSPSDIAFARAMYPAGRITGNRIKLTIKTGGDDLRLNS